jgi:hypothetical protein
MFSSVVSHSEEPDADAAVEEIVQQCKGRLICRKTRKVLWCVALSRPL